MEHHLKLQSVVSDLPVIGRLWLIFFGPLVVLLVVCIDDAVEKGGEEGRRDGLQLAPEFMHKFEYLSMCLSAEQKAALQYYVDHNKTALLSAQGQTDFAIEQMNAVALQVARAGMDPAAYKSSFNLQLLVHVRNLIVMSSVEPKYVFAQYSDLIRFSLPSVFADFDTPAKGSDLVAHVSASLSNAFLKLEQASLHVSPSHHTAELEPHLLKLRASREVFTDLLDATVVNKPWAKEILRTVKDDPNWHKLTASHVPEVRLTLPQGDQEAEEQLQMLIAAAAKDLYQRTNSYIDSSIESVAVHLSLDIACIVICIAFFFLQAGLIAIRRKNNAYETEKENELRIMVDTVDRIAEYSSHFALFDLRVPLLPVGKMLTHLELTLMKCTSALKIVAPALPPELFPERYVVKPQEKNIAQRDMCDMEIMMNQLPPHHAPSTSKNSVSPRDVNTAKALALMTKRCKLGLKHGEGSFLTVSLTWLHDRIEENQGQQPKYMQPYISLIEGVTIRYKGLVHKIFGDRMLSTWNIASSVDQHPLLACKAGLSILPESETMYNHKNIYVAAAVTYGKVFAGNVGFTPVNMRPGIDGVVPKFACSGREREGEDRASTGVREPKLESDGLRTYAMFGPPIELGGRVAFYQGFYNTSTAVLCDHEIAERVKQKLAVKPLEPIMRSDTSDEKVSIYSILGVNLGRQSEQLESLELFNTAYQLFAQRKFLEAEKAFCYYTKVYGYDNVVERLQKLVSQGKTVDDAHTFDVTHLN